LLTEQVSLYRRTNLVKPEKFSEMLFRVMKAYINGMISNEEVLAELIKMAKGDAMGLSNKELAFYDALTLPTTLNIFIKMMSLWL
jgi:type I restriction enzyme R subunit